ncbi:protein of unknown function (plasmid) [Cupriavidus taiwanensis]|uniref:Uncharacterized protein n=1 Tax=Cupriavidus taiwanensis TaxID=164546 RepID=A0A375ISW7_9BURK|nr:protein of unknown function [Cupriavidus taiwanensis]
MLRAEQLLEPELNRGGSAPLGPNFDRVLGVVQ